MLIGLEPLAGRGGELNLRQEANLCGSKQKDARPRSGERFMDAPEEWFWIGWYVLFFTQLEGRTKKQAKLFYGMSPLLSENIANLGVESWNSTAWWKTLFSGSLEMWSGIETKRNHRTNKFSLVILLICG